MTGDFPAIRACPRCGKNVAWIRYGGMLGSAVTYYHKCLREYACVHLDGSVAWNVTGWPPTSIETNQPLSEERMLIIDRLKRFEVEGLSLEEAVELSMQGEQLIDKYRRLDMPAPESVTDAVESLNANIATRAREANMKALRELELEEERLKSREEKRAGIAARRAAIEKRLGITKTEPQPVSQ